MSSMAIELTGLTRVTIGGVDLAPYVSSIRIETQPEAPADTRPLFAFKPIRIRRRVTLTPYAYRIFFRRNHPRIRRMHAAYRQRRQGRW